MNAKLTVEFLNKIKILNDKDYLISLIKFHGASTLDGKKPSCLVSFTNEKRGLYSIWFRYNIEICSLIGIEFFELYRDASRVLVLFYNSISLEETMHRPDNKRFLKGIGYGDITSAAEVLEILKTRFGKGIPHEIGILLGIPSGDVIGFIKNSGKDFIMNGYWKVYSRPERACELFQEYDNSRVNVMKNIMEKLQS